MPKLAPPLESLRCQLASDCLTRDLRDWLIAALNDCERTGARFDVALGLTPPDRDSGRRKAVLSLREAALALPEGQSTWEQAKAIVWTLEQLKRTWPHDTGRLPCTAVMTPLELACWEAYQTRQCPMTVENVYRAIV